MEKKVNNFLSEYQPQLIELKKLIIRSVVSFLIGGITGLIFNRKIILGLISLFNLQNVNIVLTSPYQFVNLAFGIAFISGLVATFPVFVYYFLRFVRPALKPHEYILFKKLIPASIFLFLFGCFFGAKIEQLICSKYHEHRLVALLVLVKKYQKGDSLLRQKIFQLYLKNTRFINNWDLVDLSAPNIVGHYLLDKDRSLLYTLARSQNLWERRISLLACFTFIKNQDFEDLISLSKILITDSHDLIHKALGWMLREMGKADQTALLKYLDRYATKLPRTALRYSIEKLPQNTRQYYLNLKT